MSYAATYRSQFNAEVGAIESMRGAMAAARVVDRYGSLGDSQRRTEK